MLIYGGRLYCAVWKSGCCRSRGSSMGLSLFGVGSGVGRSAGWLLGGRGGAAAICWAENTCSWPLLLLLAWTAEVGVVTKVKLPASLGVPSLSFLLRPPQFRRIE
jgi:hypothetical protein